tara:strand:- start:5960 stop:8032 length:2073 start_codon:yes stop_codon:yes gene_type:complete
MPHGYTQIKPAQSQYLIEKGFLINPSFEQGFKGWSFSGDCTKSLVSEVPYLNKSLKITCVGQTFSLKQETTSHAQFAGQQGVYNVQIKSNVTGAKVTDLSGGVRSNEVNIYASSNFVRVSNIPFVVSSVSNGIEIYSDAIITGEFIIDDIALALSYDNFIREDLDDVPVGTILSYGSEQIPDAYLLADGSCKLKAEFASLFSVIGTSAGECTISTSNDGFNVPDLQNQFLRGLTGGRSVFDTQADATARNGLTASSPAHGHQFRILNGTGEPDVGGGGIMTDSNAAQTNYPAYAGTPSNVSSQAIGGGTAIINLSAGDSETRPINKAVVYIIKAIGRNTQNIISQKSTSPDKAGFVIWSAFDSGNVEGHAKANGDCILKNSFPDYVANVGTTFGECTISVLNDGVNLPDLITGNRFIRSAGGGLAVGTVQADATAQNGLSTGNQSANHSHYTLSSTTASYSDSVTVNSGNYASVQKAAGSFSVNYTMGGVANVANVGISGNNSANHNHSISGDSETRPINIALVPYVRLENRDEVKINLRNGPRLGDCKYSLLSTTDFNTENEGQWVRLEGQSLTGTDIDTKFGVNSLPDAVSNGAFIRQNGGNSGALRAFQDDATAVNGLSNVGVGNHTHTSYINYSSGGGGVQYNASGISAYSAIQTGGAGAHNHSLNGDSETRPKNISLNFYCLVDK